MMKLRIPYECEPVSLGRWLGWQYVVLMGRLVGKLDNHIGRVDWRVRYGKSPDDDIPF